MSTPDDGLWAACRELVAARHLLPDPRRARTWSGVIAGAAVRLEVVPTSPRAATVRVACAHGRPGLVVTAPAHALGDVGRRLSGDPIFDELVWLADPDVTILGLLDAPMRAWLADLAVRGVHLMDGEVRLEPWAGVGPTALPTLVEAMAGLAQRIASTSRGALIQALARIAGDDPLRTVRATFRRAGDEGASDVLDALARAATAETWGPSDDNLVDLLRQVRDARLTQRTRLAALQRLLEVFPLDQCATAFQAIAPEMHGPAAKSLSRRLRLPGADVATGLGLLATLIDPRRPTLAPDAMREVAGLVGDLGDARGLPLLVTLSGDGDPQTFAAALGAMMRLPLGGDVLLDALPKERGRRERALGMAPTVALATPGASGALMAELFERYLTTPNFEWNRLTIAYIEAFATLGQSQWADTVARALDLGEDFQVAAAATLARIGTGRSLAALRPYAGGLLRPGRVKEAARAAIAAIQERVGSSGGLTLAEGDGGRLSLHDEER